MLPSEQIKKIAQDCLGRIYRSRIKVQAYYQRKEREADEKELERLKNKLKK